jgi:hypothetical protein
MIIILWAFGIFLLQSRYDFGPQAETRNTAEQSGSPLYTDGGTRDAGSQHRSIIDAPHASVNDESGPRSDRSGSWRPDYASANTLVLQDGKIPNPRLYRWTCGPSRCGAGRWWLRGQAPGESVADGFARTGRYGPTACCLPIRAADANPVRSADRDLAPSAAMEA